MVVSPFDCPCRSVDNYEQLNKIEEGTYGIVYRARDCKSGEIVALKRLKLDQNIGKDGFPITSLREIRALLMLQNHPNIVNIREIVVGSKLSRVFVVMDFIEHDLKTLIDQQHVRFSASEIKTIMHQLLSATAFMHDQWLLHRDLKTSNILFSNRGHIKVADFGLARKFGDPLPALSPLVVTLWYRAPEILLGSKDYSSSIDVWSIGCIFAELLTGKPLFPGKKELEQLSLMFKLLGTPNEKIWPGYSSLPYAKNMNSTPQPYNFIGKNFASYLSTQGIDLLTRLLAYDPKRRITCADALKHPYFSEKPFMKDPELFPTWPSLASEGKRALVKVHTPE